MPIVKIPQGGGKKKIVCDDNKKGCSRPDIVPERGECNNGHKAKEYTEADREELKGFKILADGDVNISEKDPQKLPRTPRKIYEDVLSRDKS